MSATAPLSVGAALLAQAVRVQPAAADSIHPSWGPAWAFWLLASLTVIGALLTITRRNLIGAVMSLVATFFGLASLYALLSAHFLAAIQVLVYAGAIMVLFVFVVMVLNREEAELLSLRSPVVKALGAGGLVYLAWRMGEVIVSTAPGPTMRAGVPPVDYGTTASMGDYFFTKFLFPFEAVSILLVIAVIGAVVLARTAVAKPTTVHELAEGDHDQRHIPAGPADEVVGLPLAKAVAADHGHGDAEHSHGHGSGGH